MADIALAIVSVLNGNSGVTSLIGKRLYPQYDRSTDHIYPLGCYHVQITPITAFDGAPGIEYAVITIAGIGSTQASATAVANALKAALQNQTGTWAGVVVQGCFLQDNGIRDDVVTEPTTEEIICYVRELTFDLVYNN